MAAANHTGLSPHTPSPMTRGADLFLRIAAGLFLGQSLLWLTLLLRWATFSVINWRPLAVELALAQWPSLAAYALFGGMATLCLVAGIGLWRETGWAKPAGMAAAIVTLAAGVLYYVLAREFYGVVTLIGLGGMLLLLLTRRTAWSLAFPSAYWLLIFFLIPLAIVFFVSLGERTRLGTVTYPAFDLGNLGAYFDDYARIFSRIDGEFIYLRIFGRSLWLALLNWYICMT